MEAGTLVEWLKRPGDAVKRGDIIAVVDTEKGAIEIEVFEDGTIESVQIKPGERVPVGTVLAMIGGAGPAQPRVLAAAAPAGAPVLEARPGPSSAPQPQTTPQVESRRPRVSPMARKLAADLGIDVTRIEGTGPQGAITREDVERAAVATKKPALQQPPAPTIRAAGMRTAIAAAMARSKREIPHYYLSTTIDMSAALAWLRAENEKRSVTERMLPVALLIRAVGLALGEVPELNGHWIDGGFRPGAGVHIGCAISLRGGGLVAPALHDADRMDLAALMHKLTDLVARARAGSLKSSELSDPTITVTNLGDQGVEATFGIIYPPQVALVGFGRVAARPWVRSGTIEARPLLTATLSADHRATDGHRGGVFLTAVDRLLQTPEKL